MCLAVDDACRWFAVAVRFCGWFAIILFVLFISVLCMGVRFL